MDIRALTPTYAVSPQIEPEDLATIKAAGGHYRLIPTGKRPLNYDLWASAREEWTR